MYNDDFSQFLVESTANYFDRYGKMYSGVEYSNADTELVEQLVDYLLDEGYAEDIDHALDILDELDDDNFNDLCEATRMRKELGKEGETKVRRELQSRSWAHKRSGSVDKTIAAAERKGGSQYGVSSRKDAALKLAANRRGSVRDTPRAGLRGYSANVKGSDKELQRARSGARIAGTLTPKEKRQLGYGESFDIYDAVFNYLLDEGHAVSYSEALNLMNSLDEETIDDIVNELSEASDTSMKLYHAAARKSANAGYSSSPMRPGDKAHTYSNLAARAGSRAYGGSGGDYKRKGIGGAGGVDRGKGNKAARRIAAMRAQNK